MIQVGENKIENENKGIVLLFSPSRRQVPNSNLFRIELLDVTI